ncbi:phosphoribosylformylglycinamidine synthase subunit PurL [Puniceicoccus vermicola]|nr:phosphoribosylformylglycinamidine synthase subunit PurL [Puniceicoccus vermicola]
MTLRPGSPDLDEMTRANSTPITLDFSNIDEDAIRGLIKEHNLALTPDEALQIQNRILKRPPTLAECVLWSIQGSEHCSYKSSRTHLKQFVTDGPNVILGPSEDAGIVEIARDKDGVRYGLAASHESHNHPSQVVPYEGAATGVGGNVRDVCCMGAKVVAVGDGLRFGDIKLPKSKWIQEGVVAGIAGYGNPLGIPNLCGDVYFDPGYNDNCLVTVMTLGAISEKAILHSYAPKNADGYDLILVGKPTDNSGFGGASFASGELDEKEKEKNKGAVQEPNAFLERHLLKATYALHKILIERGDIDRVGFKDLGAGGIACASVEIADSAGYGAEVEVEKVHVGMEGLPPHVILCSETQERFMWAVPHDLTDLILEHYNSTFALPEVSNGAKASVVGRIREDGLYRVTWHGETLVEAKASEVTKGIVYDREYVLPTPKDPPIPEPSVAIEDLGKDLLSLLAHPNISSRKPIFESYDKQVQGATQVEAGRGDAGVFRPFVDPEWPEEIRETGAVISLDQNPRHNRSDSERGAAWAVVESYRNVSATGGRPVAFTDCLCYGNPEKPEQMGDFVAGMRGVAETAKSFHLTEHPDSPIPIIGGNVSLYNESQGQPIPPSPMIACLGRMPDASKAVPFGFQSTGNRVYHVGEFCDTLAGSLFLEQKGLESPRIPAPELKEIETTAQTIVQAIEAGQITACHDVSDGGLLVALAECSIANRIGFSLSRADLIDNAAALFGEFGGYVAEVSEDQAEAFEQLCAERKVPLTKLGMTGGERFQLGTSLDLSVSEISETWENGLRIELDS